MLVAGGVPIAEAVAALEEACGEPALAEAYRTLHTGLRHGEKFSVVLEFTCWKRQVCPRCLCARCRTTYTVKIWTFGLPSNSIKICLLSLRHAN
jgi:hypothetical protein